MFAKGRQLNGVTRQPGLLQGTRLSPALLAEERMRRDEARASTRVVITGGNGMVGQALAVELRDAGYDEVSLLNHEDVDLRDAERSQAAIAATKPDVVYHLAARVHGIMGNLRARADVYLDNIRINTNVVEGARQAGARKVVAMGSTAVYSDLAPLPMREADIWVGAPHGSEAAYAHAKRAMLAHLEACHDQYGLDFSFLIATNMFGPHDRFDEQNGHVIPSLLSKFERAIRTGNAVEIWGSGTPRRDFLFAADAARAIRLAGEQMTGAINLATGATVSIAELVDILVDVTGFNGAVLWDRSKPDGQVLRAYDTSRLRELGFAPRFSLAAALEQTFAWLQAHRAQARR